MVQAVSERARTQGRMAVAGIVALVASTAVSAQEVGQGPVPAVDIERAIYLTCREVSEMTAQDRQAIAVALGRHSATHRGLQLPLPAEAGDDLAYLVRGGCTLYPDAYLFAVIDRAIISEMIGPDG